jgi:hypothetical protein
MVSFFIPMIHSVHCVTRKFLPVGIHAHGGMVGVHAINAIKGDLLQRAGLYLGLVSCIHSQLNGFHPPLRRLGCLHHAALDIFLVDSSRVGGIERRIQERL